MAGLWGWDRSRSPFPAGRTGSACIGLACLAVTAAACGGAGTFVWYSQVPADQVAASRELIIHKGDTLSRPGARPRGDERSSRRKVRSDGRIAVPLIGEVEAQGKRPSALRSELEGRLKDYIVSPSVMLNVDEVEPMTIVLLGEVAHPGAYQLEPATGIAQALAMGGGLTEYAKRDRIFIVRQLPKPSRIRFTYDMITRDEVHAATFPLRTGDVVVVE